MKERQIILYLMNALKPFTGLDESKPNERNKWQALRAFRKAQIYLNEAKKEQKGNQTNENSVF